MSLYNALFGVSEDADILLAALGITRGDVPRFRDCFLDDQNRLVIYTRTGGGNREYYEDEVSCRAHYPEYFTGTDDPKGPWNDDLCQLSGYLSDEDDDFDSTYASFYFAPPEGLAHLLQKMNSETVALNPKDKWQLLFQDLQTNNESPEAKNALEVGKRIFEQLNIDSKIIEI